MKALCKFFRSLYIFLKLYRTGFYLSGLWSRSPGGVCGFYRLNYERGGTKEFAIVDIDFSKSQLHEHQHLHGGSDNTKIFRVDDNEITISSKFIVKLDDNEVKLSRRISQNSPGENW